MDVQGGHLWVGMRTGRYKGTLGHGNAGRRGTGGRCGPELRSCRAYKIHKNDTTKQEIPMGAVLTGGLTEHIEGSKRTNTKRQKRQRRKR